MKSFFPFLWSVALVAAVSAAVAAEPAAPAAAGGTALPAPAAAPPSLEPPGRLVLSRWQSLYEARQKIGYIAESLYVLPDGGRRLQANLFLRHNLGTARYGFFKMITADVDARFRPRALQCRVSVGERQWEVKGQIEDGELALVRTIDGVSTSARIPLDEDVTFLSWALDATRLSGAAPGETRRWLVIDESIGALLPNPCLVHRLGPRTATGSPGTPSVSGTALIWACGAEEVVHLVDSDGRVLRSIWQSSPLVGEGTTLLDAQRLTEFVPSADRSGLRGPQGPEIEGFEAERYRDSRHGFSLYVPPYPYVAHANHETGAVAIVDWLDEASFVARLAPLPQPVPSASEADLGRVADLLEHEWAARYEDVRTEKPGPTQIGGRPAWRIDGTARLGCTTFNFRNYLVASGGLAYFLSITVADRPVSSESVLAQDVLQSLRLAAPEGPLALLASGNLVRSPYYGFELSRPNARWIVPNHLEGPAAVLEMARQDHAAVVIIRVAAPRPGQSLENFAADQAQQAADNLSVTKPEPKPTTLGGRPAVEISYEGAKVLSDRPAQCTLVYVSLDGRILSLALIAAADADTSAQKELGAIRESVRFSPPP